MDHIERRISMAAIADIEGIGAAYAEKLRRAGIGSVEALLKAGALAEGRKVLEAATGIDHARILEWVNHADLFRIRGVGSEYSDLLEEAGVDTVVELAQRNPASLHQALLDCNTQKKLVRKLPTATQVAAWVQQAKSLPRVVKY
jgi:predicted flap endonuclease-1-like 5' DNA nuclease